MTSAASIPCGTMIALTVLEYHLGSLAQSRNPQAATAARTPSARTWWRSTEQDVQGLPQSIKHGQRRRVGKIPCSICFHLVAEIKKCSRATSVLVGCQRLCAGANNAEACWKHQPFLRSGDSQINSPIIHPEIDARNGAHAVYVEHRRMPGSIYRPPYRCNVACDPCGGLVVND